MWGACGWAVWGSTASPDVKRQSPAGPPVPCPAACTIVSSSHVAFSSCFSAYGKKRRRPEHRAPAHPEDRKAIRCTRMCGCRPSPFCRRALLLSVSSYTGKQVRRVLHLVDNGTASLAVLWCPSNPDANTRICTLLHGVLCGWWPVAPSCPRCFYASCMIDYLFPFLF